MSTKTLSPIIQEQIDTVQRRIDRAERRIERATRVEEVVEVVEDEKGKKTKTKKRVVTPEDKAIATTERARIDRLEKVIEQMRDTGELVFNGGQKARA